MSDILTTILARKADLLLRLGNREGALAAMDRSLFLQPNQPELREHAEHLRAAASRFEDAYRRERPWLYADPGTP